MINSDLAHTINRLSKRCQNILKLDDAILLKIPVRESTLFNVSERVFSE